MPTNIFSTYSAGENRVTSSIIAVLRSLSLSRTERLLGALLERPQLSLLEFENQPAKGGAGVPDAIIRANFCILVETKLKPNSLNTPQLQRHLTRLNQAPEADRTLLVLTPDRCQPHLIEEFQNPMVAWTSFAALDQAIDELLADGREVVSEREAFLLRELQTMLDNEGLVTSVANVLVVAARQAWPEYERYHAYACQADRTFRHVQRMAFYSGGKIWPVIPAITDRFDRVEFVAGRYDGPLGHVVDRMLADRTPHRTVGSVHKILLLTPPESPETEKLPGPVINDLTSESGRPTAYTQGQRYVSLDRLKKATRTSELADSRQ